MTAPQSPPNPEIEARIQSFLASLKRYRWWDARATGRAAVTAIRERISAHLEALAPYGLGPRADVWVAQLPPEGWQRAPLDGTWTRAVDAAVAALAPGMPGPPPADELARVCEPAITDVIDDPIAASAALDLIAREVAWMRLHPDARSPWTPLLGVWSLGAWPVGLTTEGYFLVCVRDDKPAT